jgi:hypothetical protein
LLVGYAVPVGVGLRLIVCSKLIPWRAAQSHAG